MYVYMYVPNGERLRVGVLKPGEERRYPRYLIEFTVSEGVLQESLGGTFYKDM